MIERTGVNSPLLQIDAGIGSFRAFSEFSKILSKIEKIRFYLGGKDIHITTAYHKQQFLFFAVESLPIGR